jgi:hypothetical protein
MYLKKVKTKKLIFVDILKEQDPDHDM